MTIRCCSLGVVATLLILSSTARAQESPRLGGPFSRDIVAGAPFSAVATTTVRDVYPDGTTKERAVVARYFRSSQGQVRAEVDTDWGPYVVVASADPVPREVYVLDPVKRTYMTTMGVWFAEVLFNGEAGVALPAGKHCFEYGPFVAQGATASERLRAVAADVSPDIGLVRSSHRDDDISLGEFSVGRAKRTLDYALTHIRLEEPASGLFVVPSDYTPDYGRSGVPLVRWTHRQSCRSRH